MKYFDTVLLVLVSCACCSQSNNTKPVKKVLFIGNSYTYYNNLPQICVGIAASLGDVLITDYYAPGGWTFEDQLEDSAALQKIRQGAGDYNKAEERMDWDYVVLQEQSQLPSQPADTVAIRVLPYAHKLDSVIHQFNPSAKTVFYMTWGRKNGDTSRCAEWPPVCTYNGMDSLLAMNYKLMALENKAMLAPVGAVWNTIRNEYPSIELYAADGSHPTEAGSYAAACCFYTVFYRKDPALIKFNYTLDPSTASKIRKVVRRVAYDTPQNQPLMGK